MSSPIASRILLADDHVVVREGLRAMLEREGFSVVAEASDGRDALKLAQQHQPNIAILDLTMPVLNGLDATRELIGLCPRIKVILLTMHSEDQYVMQALRAGVRGYVLKSKASAALLEAIREVQQGNVYISPGVSRGIVDRLMAKEGPDADILSARERQVVQLIAESKSTKEIATILGISVKTVESHRSNIMEKLNLHDTAGVVRYAIRRGLTQA